MDKRSKRISDSVSTMLPLLNRCTNALKTYLKFRGGISELLEDLRRSPAMSARRAKFVSWSASLADLRDSNRRTSSRRFCNSIAICKEKKIRYRKMLRYIMRGLQRVWTSLTPTMFWVYVRWRKFYRVQHRIHWPTRNQPLQIIVMKYTNGSSVVGFSKCSAGR